MAGPDSFPFTCVIGAGPSGLCASKALGDRGVPFDCFERSERVGGLWAFGNPGGTPTAYRSLRINTSKRRTQLADFPMPADYSDFPHHTQVASYLESYAERFGLTERITFGTGVERARLEPEGTWEVALDSGDVRHYDALVVANGHHWDPRWPEPPIPGRFDGLEMHSRDYTDAQGLEGRRVVVVGIGNSAMDIVVDIAASAERTYLSARRGAHILPHYLLGRPMDHLELVPPRWLPRPVRGKLAGALFEIGRRREAQRPEDYGLPAPRHRVHEAHPTVSDGIFDAIAAGLVEPKPGLAAREGDSVRFDDGSSERADAIVYCTGYRVSFPFFDEDLISAPGNDLPLYRRVFHPDIDSVFFIGLVQPIGATIRAVEAQAKWVAAHLCGAYALPSRERMQRDMARERERMFGRYVSSPRHTMQVDFLPYLAGIDRELRAGARRARRRGYSPPLEPKAKRRWARPSPSAQAV